MILSRSLLLALPHAWTKVSLASSVDWPLRDLWASHLSLPSKSRPPVLAQSGFSPGTSPVVTCCTAAHNLYQSSGLVTAPPGLGMSRHLSDSHLAARLSYSDTSGIVQVTRSILGLSCEAGRGGVTSVHANEERKGKDVRARGERVAGRKASARLGYRAHPVVQQRRQTRERLRELLRVEPPLKTGQR